MRKKMEMQNTKKKGWTCKQSVAELHASGLHAG